jgi:hypothetical protein
VKPSIFAPTKLSNQLTPEREPLMVSVLVTTLYSVVSIAVCNGVFLWFARDFAGYRQPRTEFAFVPPIQDVPFFVLWWLVGLASLRMRNWILPLVVGAVVSSAFLPAYAWSGPGDLLNSIRPLISLRMNMFSLSALINTLLIVFYLRYGLKRRSQSGTPKPN